MNACGQASTALNSPPRYVPGYLALSSPKFTQPIELKWPQNGGLKPIRLLPPTSTAHSENGPLLTTPGITSTCKSVNLTVPSHPSRHITNGGNYDSPALPLVEHANRAEIHRRQKRVESETSEALRGDIEWVRSGGVLRDSNGRRDFARTKRIRDQLDEQERERKVMAAWAEYEDRWRASLVIGCGRRTKDPSMDVESSEGRDRDQGIGFMDVAWPVATLPEGPEELTVGAVKEFVLAPLRRKDIAPSNRKDRVRQLLLRYHPDKTAFLLSRVAEEEKDRVLEGINNVFMSLKSLQGDPEVQDSK